LRIINKNRKLFLNDRVCLVYGLSSDIGLEIAKLLIENGMFVSGTYCNNYSAVETLIKEYGDKVKSYKLDIRNDSYKEDIKKIVKSTFEWRKRIDVLLNVAGSWMIKPFLHERKESKDELWKLNYEGPYYFAQEVIKKMIVAGYGDIINISSSTGHRGAGQLITYASTKAALLNLTKSLAEEFGPRNIKVNSISPGTTDTKAINSHLDKVAKELLVKNIPKSRLCLPIDIANAVLAILINDYMTGNDILLHGGKL
jgi:3-oxoacyl-[acyl-carrier protein] reductase